MLREAEQFFIRKAKGDICCQALDAVAGYSVTNLEAELRSASLTKTLKKAPIGMPIQVD